MKIQISTFSPHQTAKVIALTMVVSSMLFFIPLMLLSTFFQPPVDPQGNEIKMFFPLGMMTIIGPLFQGVFGYLMARFGIFVYNRLYKKIGGLEFEIEEVNL